MSHAWEARVARGFSWLAACALAVAGLFPGNNPDTFGHLAQGRQIVELGYVPQFDTWSLLPGAPRPWHNYEWLSDLLFYGLYAWLGYDGVLLFKCGLLLVTGLALLSFARKLGGERAVVLGALVLIASIPAVRMRLSDRPHVLGLCLAAFYLVLLSGLLTRTVQVPKQKTWPIVALLFVLHVFWVNVHGSHLLGLAIILAFLVSAKAPSRKVLWSVLGLSGLASCISPYGPYIVTDALAHVLDPRYRALVSEWSAWSTDDPPWLQLGPALHGALCVVVGPRLAREGGPARASLLVGLMLGIASFRSIRFVAEFMLLTTPLLAAGYAMLLKDVSFRRFMAPACAVLVGFAWIVPYAARGLPPFHDVGHGISYRERPHGPGSMLREARIAPRVLATMENSWYLMWEAPRARFYIDGRVPFYGPEHVQHASRAFADPRVLEEVLRESDINAVLLKHTLQQEHAMLDAFRKRPRWSLVLVDDGFALFVREDLRAASRFTALKTLVPGFEMDWILELRPALRPMVEQELSQLARFPTSLGYRSWIAALFELAPLKRGGAQGGFRWPVDAADFQAYTRAKDLLRVAAETADTPLVLSMLALTQVSLCELEEASRALDRLELHDDLNREGVLLRHEIALRRGEKDDVDAFLRAATALPGGQDDAWLRELSRGLTNPPACAAP